jgi:hypothetical protein
MTDDGSLTGYERDLHAPDPALRLEAARQIWARFVRHATVRRSNNGGWAVPTSQSRITM